jgi:hypothetical protein
MAAYQATSCWDATTVSCRATALVVTTHDSIRPSAPGMTMPRDWLPLCTGVNSTSFSVGIIASNAVLAAWFMQMGLQTTASTMRSAENWSVVSVFKHVASRA